MWELCFSLEECCFFTPQAAAGEPTARSSERAGAGRRGALGRMAPWVRVSLRGVRALNERVGKAFLPRPPMHLLSRGQGLRWASRRALPHIPPRDFTGGGGFMPEDAAGRLPRGPPRRAGRVIGSAAGGAGRGESADREGKPSPLPIRTRNAAPFHRLPGPLARSAPTSAGPRGPGSANGPRRPSDRAPNSGAWSPCPLERLGGGWGRGN